MSRKAQCGGIRVLLYLPRTPFSEPHTGAGPGSRNSDRNSHLLLRSYLCYFAHSPDTGGQRCSTRSCGKLPYKVTLAIPVFRRCRLICRHFVLIELLSLRRPSSCAVCDLKAVNDTRIILPSLAGPRRVATRPEESCTRWNLRLTWQNT